VKEAAPVLVRPFLKWPGGKFRLVSTLKSYLHDKTCLVEPFVGAGALFLNTTHPQVILNDINPDLINLFSQLQTKSDKLIGDVKKLFVSKNNQAKVYYRWRTRFNNSKDKWERAVLFLYLNRHGYNGLCRYNAKGYYNVPFGDYRRPYFPQHELEVFSSRAQKVIFHCQDYSHLLRSFLQQPTLDHMVFYCDPPYAPLSTTANFTGYAAQRFTLEDQKQLAHYAKALAKKGALVLISNHNTPFTREIYRGATCQEIEVRRTISCQVTTRNKVSELIACFSPVASTSKRSRRFLVK
jgi:DNA adenine methylase